MPPPRPYPHADKINADAGNQPDIIRLLNRVPKIIQLQAAQGEPDEEDANEYAEPEMPFFHAADFITGGGARRPLARPVESRDEAKRFSSPKFDRIKP